MVTAALNLGWEAHLQHLTVLGLKKKKHKQQVELREVYQALKEVCAHLKGKVQL